MFFAGWKKGTVLIAAAALVAASCGGSGGGGGDGDGDGDNSTGDGDGDGGDGDIGDGDGDGDGDGGDGDGDAGDGDGDGDTGDGDGDLGGGAGASGDGDQGTGGGTGGGDGDGDTGDGDGDSGGGGNAVATTTAVGGGGNACDSVVCDAPPDQVCVDGAVTGYEPSGVCSQGDCDYSSWSAPCTSGCSGDACACADSAAPLVTAVFSSQSEMAIDSQGGIHVVYKPGLEVLYAYRPAEGAWNQTIAIPDNAGTGIALALDSNDGVHIAINRGGENGLGYAYRSAGGTFSTETILGTAGMGQGADIALDSSDNIYIVHMLDEVDNVDDRLELTTKIGNGDFVTAPLFSAEDEVRSPGTIAIGPDDTIYVAYTDNTTYNSEKLRLATRAPNSATFVASDIDAARYGSAGSLVVDHEGGLHISYYDNSNFNGYLRYGYRASGSSTWQTVQADSVIRAGFDSSMAVERDGTVHIIHHLVGNTLSATASLYDLRYSMKEPGGSFSSVTLEEAGIVGEGPSMALETGGIVHAVYGNRNESPTQANWTLDYRRICPD